ncbi:MAG: RNA polymerase sigma-70 factor Rhodopirellula/Verrucomicrobium family [Limisphaerales bacterium]|nr:MAG: RNA polymerase sigma-70 factor Rhodopirellula/Verrucomicrobium family [Limisphaerales bacterium]TXT47794.1 MAG: RNA polymerase sigma-70 factor Rhodopirellula/Verrucomicrobium family [Limisphaerales bacterium]
MPEPSTPAPEPADAQLARDARDGDSDAFAALLDRHLPHVRTFLALKAPVPQLVDELAHDTFVFAYRHLDEFDPDTSFRAWLRAIAWNLLRAEVQRFARERVQLERFAAWQLEEWTAAAPEPSAEAEHLIACVGELPEPLRQLVALKYQEERSGEEIAARLDRSAVWVRVSLFRVRQLLRECVERKAAPAGPETSPA